MRISNKLGLAVSAVLGLSAVATAGMPTYSLTTLATFNGTNGNNPEGGELVLSGSTLYGTTRYGGALSSYGTVFSVPVTGGTPTTLAAFNGTNGCQPLATLALSGTTLYGTTQGNSSATSFGTVFSVSTTGDNFTNLATISVPSSIGPHGGVIVSGSTLYGTSYAGGANSGGMVFSVPASGGNMTALHSWSNSGGNATNGFAPVGSIVLSGSTLYGVTTSGGANSYGTLYSVSTTGGNYTTLASFSSVYGRPEDGLIISGSTIYGTTYGTNGPTDYGSVYSVSTSGGNITTLATFNGTNGNEPMCELALSGSTLYGTTYEGGAYNDGTVFSVPTDGGGTAADVTTLYSFSGTDGMYPDGGVIISGGDIYGTTLIGADNSGTVFELTPTAVPEPASLGLLVAGGVGVLARRRRRRV